MNVIVTGSTGLIGSLLVANLLKENKYKVTALARSQKAVEKLNYTLKKEGQNIDNVNLCMVDMLDFNEVKNAFTDTDIVFHTAAIVDLSGEDVVAENVRLTEITVEACLAQSKKPLLIFTSSIAALPETIDKLQDASPYSKSKFLSENQIWRAQKLGLRVGVVAPAVVLGVGAPGSGGLQPVVRMLSGGIPFYVRGGTGFVDVRDVVRAMIRVAENEELQGCRLVLCGANLVFRDFIGMIAERSGKRKPFFEVREWMFDIAVRLMGWFMKKPPLTSEMKSFMFSVSCYDGTLIEQKDPTYRYTSIAETIEMLVKSNSNPI